MDRSQRPPMSLRFPRGDTLLGLLVVGPTAFILVFEILRAPPPANLIQLAAWTALIAAIELLQVATWGGVQVSLGFPLLTAVALLYPPGFAAGVAFVGSLDPRELRREVTPLRAVFNRSQVA